MNEHENLNFCPWCGKKLEEGTFQSRGGNYFLPLNEPKPLLYSKVAMDKRNAILLPPHFLFTPIEYPKAYTCRNCKKLVIPY